MTATATLLKTNETSVAIENFAKVVKDNSQKEVGKPAELRALIQKCKDATPPIYEESRVAEYLKARSKTLSQLIDGYFMARMTAKYPLISPDLFKMRRFLTLDGKGHLILDRTKADKKVEDARQCETPLFAQVPLFGERNVILGKTQKRSSNSYSTTTHTTTISATLPMPPHDIVKDGRKALGTYYTIVGEVYSDDVLCDLLRDKKIETPELAIIWIPTPKSLVVKTTSETQQKPKPAPVVVSFPSPAYADPALILKINDSSFLVSCYDIEEEQPIEGYLREFSVGDLGSILKKK